MIFIQISQAFIDGGFNLALIQKKDTDEEDFSSVFYINLAVSSVLYIILFFSAPLISAFYHQSLLTSLTRVLSLVFLINAFSYVQEAKLTKEIRFKTLMYIHIPSSLIGGTISVIMAFTGFGVWSIVAFQLVSRMAYAIQIWIYAKWKPLLIFSWKKAKALFAFGSRLLIAKIIGVLYNNIFLVVIGKFYPVASVGYYQNAFNLVNTPSNTITSVLGSVTFPAFSSIQDDNKRLKAGYRRVMQQAFFWLCPAYVFAGILASPLFLLLFGAQWLPAVPYFRWLCIIGILMPLNNYNLNIVNVKGRSDVFLNLQLVRRAVTVVAIVMVFSWGITALLVVQAASCVFTFVLFSYYSGKFIDYSMKEQIADFLPILLLSLMIGCLLVILDKQVGSWSNSFRLIAEMAIGWGLYWLLANMFKVLPWIEFKHVLQIKIFNKYLKS
jgi:O-antigen/teichoic acid export membrane protein